MKDLEYLYKCLVTQHEEIYKAPQRIKKFKIYNFKAEIYKNVAIGADGRATAE